MQSCFMLRPDIRKLARVTIDVDALWVDARPAKQRCDQYHALAANPGSANNDLKCTDVSYTLHMLDTLGASPPWAARSLRQPVHFTLSSSRGLPGTSGARRRCAWAPVWASLVGVLGVLGALAHGDVVRRRGTPDGLPPALHNGHLLPARQQLAPLQLLDRPAWTRAPLWDRLIIGSAPIKSSQNRDSINENVHSPTSVPQVGPSHGYCDTPPSCMKLSAGAVEPHAMLQQRSRVSLVEGGIGVGQELQVDGGDAVIQGQAALHRPVLRERVDRHVWPVVAQQRGHVALQTCRQGGPTDCRQAATCAASAPACRLEWQRKDAFQHAAVLLEPHAAQAGNIPRCSAYYHPRLVPSLRLPLAKRQHVPQKHWAGMTLHQGWHCLHAAAAQAHAPCG